MEGLLGTNLVIQIGIVVNDIVKATEAYADFFGVPNPGYFETAPIEDSHTSFHGEFTEGRCLQSFFNCGQLKIELLQPDNHPSAWREGLDKNGEGIHHIAFCVKDLRGKVKLLEEHGYHEIQSGGWIKTKKKNTSGLYSYIDATEKLKILFELLEYLE